MDNVGWMVGSAFWWLCSYKFCEIVREQASNRSPLPTSIDLCCSTDPQASNSPCVFVRLCVGLYVWVYLCVSKEEENDEGEKKSKLVLQMEKKEREREKKKTKCEINKIIVYTATLIVYICTVTVPNV